jgi:tyrosyl-tRNA synthetase
MTSTPSPTPEIDRRAALIERNLAELLTREELPALLATGQRLKHYIGYEISGRVHLGGGLVAMAKVRDFQEAGVDCSVLLADWHTWINDKLGGDRDRIRRLAVSYYGEAMKASLLCVGGDAAALRLTLASDVYADPARDYWATVIEVAKHTSVARMQRSITILGRKEGEQHDFAKLIYPAMQAADIFALGVHIAHAGMDQRKAHVVARDVATKIRINTLRDAAGTAIKPLAAHHPLLTGLLKPDRWPVPPEGRAEALAAMKMSKSKPRSAVFVHDSPDEMRRLLPSGRGRAESGDGLDRASLLRPRRHGAASRAETGERRAGDLRVDPGGARGLRLRRAPPHGRQGRPGGPADRPPRACPEALRRPRAGGGALRDGVADHGLISGAPVRGPGWQRG